jgi:hypothetical protein
MGSMKWWCVKEAQWKNRQSSTKEHLCHEADADGNGSNHEHHIVKSSPHPQRPPTRGITNVMIMPANMMAIHQKKAWSDLDSPVGVLGMDGGDGIG